MTLHSYPDAVVVKSGGGGVIHHGSTRRCKGEGGGSRAFGGTRAGTRTAGALVISARTARHYFFLPLRSRRKFLLQASVPEGTCTRRLGQSFSQNPKGELRGERPSRECTKKSKQSTLTASTKFDATLKAASSILDQADGYQCARSPHSGPKERLP